MIRSLAFYEIENEDVEGTLRKIKEAQDIMHMEPLIDFSKIQISTFESITDVIGHSDVRSHRV